MPSPCIYFVRHGQTSWNAEERLQGQADTDLNDLGRTQAARNGALLRDLIPDPSSFDYVSSPLRRTRDTMEIIRRELGLDPVDYRTDARLMELHFGDWQGHTFAELEVLDPGCFARREERKWRYVPPGEGAESYAMLVERVRLVIEGFTRDTVCVAHGGILRSVIWLFGNLSEPECAALSIHQDKVLRYQDGGLEWL